MIFPLKAIGLYTSPLIRIDDGFTIL